MFNFWWANLTFTKLRHRVFRIGSWIRVEHKLNTVAKPPYSVKRSGRHCQSEVLESESMTNLKRKIWTSNHVIIRSRSEAEKSWSTKPHWGDATFVPAVRYLTVSLSSWADSFLIWKFLAFLFHSKMHWPSDFRNPSYRVLAVAPDHPLTNRLPMEYDAKPRCPAEAVIRAFLQVSEISSWLIF